MPPSAPSLSLAAAALVLAAPARADLVYPDFASTSGLTLVGSAARVGNVLRLVPATGTVAGGTWAATKQAVSTGFETTFRFQLGTGAGADGFAFVLQNGSASPLGGAGCELGYHGLVDSLAVEFDTYSNASCSVANVNDPAGLHVSVHTGGVGANSIVESFSIGSSAAVPDFADGNVHTARIRYFAGTLSVYVDNLTQPVVNAAIQLDTALTLDNGKAWVGFTAATGGLAEAHDLLDWTFDETPATGGNQPPLAPSITEPATNGTIVNASDVHMETSAFSDPDVGDQHFCTDWEIWLVSPSQRVWSTLCIQGVERVHTHFGDGTFENSHAGRSDLLPSTNYVLRVRHSDDSGDALTRWSAWSQRSFTTGAATQTFALELEDVAATPPPVWRVSSSGSPAVFPFAVQPSRLSIEAAAGNLLYEFVGADGLSNQRIDAPGLPGHADVRVRVTAGSSGLSLPATELALHDDHCDSHRIFVPAVSLAAGASAQWWIAASGAAFLASGAQTQPVFNQLARSPNPPWSARQPGYEVEVFATGFQLPINIAFVPGVTPQGPATAPFLYVTELYGRVKTVLRNRTVVDYATGLLNFPPTGAFPGSGEQGVTGLAVDPATGDLIVAMLYAPAGSPQNHNPKLVRFSSNDGGRTMATATTILDMPGEVQGQSHQISNLTLLPDGTLLCHMGDGFDSATAQNLNSFRGKILRLNIDGTPVPSNPFYNALDGITSRDYVYAYGVRNPFGGDWRAVDNSQYVVENGPSIDRFARIVMGRNYLWDGSDASMQNFALHNWNPAAGPVNLAFIQPESFGGSGFPASKWGHAFVTESGPTYANGQNTQGKRITEWILDANGALLSGPLPFVEYSGYRRATACGLEAGPDGLYFTDLYADDGGSAPSTGANLLRIHYRTPVDCNANGVDDACDVITGASADTDLNGNPDECDCLGTRYCVALQNSQGCFPVISATGAATLGAPDNFVVRASNVLNNRQGLLMWGTSATFAPLGAGVRCVGVPIRRMPVQTSGGSPTGTDCSGTYAQPFNDTIFAANGLLAGQLIHFQWWSRDNGYAAPNNFGLSDALRVMVCP